MEETPLALMGLVLAISVWAGAHLYRRAWRSGPFPAGTPTGFGLFLPWAVLAFMAARGAGSGESLALGLAGIFTAIYWIDDIRGLSPRVRLTLSFIAGVAMGAAAVTDAALDVRFAALLVFGAGSLCVVLTNIINFYDGADLNLATLAALFGALVWFGSLGEAGAAGVLGMAVACFALGFGVVNRVPMSVYLGDAGSFGLAAIITWLVCRFFSGHADAGAAPLAALALPAFDVFYVLLIRLTHRHDLLSRNYLHLYQRLQIRFGGWFYLLPQIACVLLVSGLAKMLAAAGIPAGVSMVLSCLLAVPPAYLALRRLFVEPEFFFGDGKPP